MMKRNNLSLLVQREWPHIIFAVRGTIAALAVAVSPKLSAALQRPEEILSVLEDVSLMLCRATERQHGVHDPAVRPLFYAMRDTQPSPAAMSFAVRGKSPCPI
ncbi:hypothetical protein OR1_00016 [Geobacter sp. OR-1]|uniref:hypothetical protein n=1 Tax=Geobacter sp. OR-1 TaxID=1266765 RepID=UPI00054271FB|nr:hypothetical protein [Geobacter sp. OR-1]GAM07748.1 hypothetical protein OR1_00016 [Geobacter sp. OR-1]